MLNAPKLTAESYECLVADLRGRVISSVDYFVLTGGEEGTEISDWDYGTWHEPTMGVSLTVDDGITYTAIWGNTFDYYGLELYPTPTSDYLVQIGLPGTSAPRVVATDHPLWADLVHAPIEYSRIHWCNEEHGAPSPVPDAIYLRTAAAQVWIVAGRSATYPPDGSFHLGTDDVFVAFDPDTATQAGLKIDPCPDPAREDH